jgi:hypothetical protein
MTVRDPHERATVRSLKKNKALLRCKPGEMSVAGTAKPLLTTKCDLCEQTFESSSVSGVITMNRIVQMRREWGLTLESKRFSAPSFLYTQARLCVFCSQFFPAQDFLAHDEHTVMHCTSPQRSTTSRPSSLQLLHGPGTGSAPLLLLRPAEAVVEETDLARRSAAKAQQSSIADNMGATVCLEPEWRELQSFADTAAQASAFTCKLQIYPVHVPVISSTHGSLHYKQKYVQSKRLQHRLSSSYCLLDSMNTLGQQCMPNQQQYLSTLCPHASMHCRASAALRAAALQQDSA